MSSCGAWAWWLATPFPPV